MSKAAGLTVPAQDYMLAQILDRLDLLIWQNTKDGHEGKNAPKQRAEGLKIHESNTEVFDSPEAFDAYRANIFNTPERGD